MVQGLVALTPLLTIRALTDKNPHTLPPPPSNALPCAPHTCPYIYGLLLPPSTCTCIHNPPPLSASMTMRFQESEANPYTFVDIKARAAGPSRWAAAGGI